MLKVCSLERDLETEGLWVSIAWAVSIYSSTLCTSQMMSKREDCLSLIFRRELSPRAIFPKTAGSVAPVAVQILLGIPFRVKYASIANPTASLASGGICFGDEEGTKFAWGNRAVRRCIRNVFFQPPPEMITSTGNEVILGKRNSW